MNEKKQTAIASLSIYSIGREIVSVLAGLQPGKSFSFILNEQGISALKALCQLYEEKIPQNMTRIKESLDQILLPLSNEEPGIPLNLNLSEDDIRAMEKVLDLVDRFWDVTER